MTKANRLDADHDELALSYQLPSGSRATITRLRSDGRRDVVLRKGKRNDAMKKWA